jgi:hypothetical protein
MAGAAEAGLTLPGRVCCDTSYFYGCASTHDMHWRRALALASKAASRGTQLWTTWDGISETITLLRYRHSSAAANVKISGTADTRRRSPGWPPPSRSPARSPARLGRGSDRGRPSSRAPAPRDSGARCGPGRTE